MKRVFYYTDVLPLLSRQEAAISKIKKNMEFFYSHRDEVELVWHPYEQMMTYLEMNDSPVREEFLELLQEFQSAGWGVLDENENPKDVLQRCDAYYGDASDLAWYACESGSPALLIDYGDVGEMA